MKDTIDTVLTELNALYDELGIFDKQTILQSLCNLRDNIVQTYNVLDIKAAYAENNLGHIYTCVYVEEHSVYIIAPISWVSIDTTIEINGDDISFKVKGQHPLETNTDEVIIGVTEPLAWCAAYNKLLA
jgi:hypothetical protein